MHKTRFLALLAGLILLPTSLVAQPTEIYQDFRGKRPLIPEFHLYGPDLEAVTNPEDAGFRVTLPRTRKVNQAVQVAAEFVITGDFEITGTFELLAADMPKNGWGVGVSMNIATTQDLHKFLKISRVNRPEQENPSVFMAEYWTKGANDWRGPRIGTDARSGQLRLMRVGPLVRSQFSDGPGQAFQTVFEKEDFGTEDIVLLRYEVTDGNKPGYAVDARLIDLRVRYGNRNADAKKADAPAPVPVNDQPKTGNRTTLIVVLILGMAIMLMMAIAVGTILYVRSRGKSSAPPIVTFPCPSCGQNLKVKAAPTGKKVKCPKCGKAVPVPSNEAADV